MRCSFCGRDASEAGFLCWKGYDYNPAMPTLECKACVLKRAALNAELRIIAEDLEDRARHLASCEWCYANKSLYPRLLLGQVCLSRRLAAEAKAEESREVVV